MRNHRDRNLVTRHWVKELILRNNGHSLPGNWVKPSPRPGPGQVIVVRDGERRCHTEPLRENHQAELSGQARLHARTGVLPREKSGAITVHLDTDSMASS